MTAKQKANQLRFKKVVAEAKKLRSKNPKLTQAQAVKKAWEIFKKGGKVGENHKDIKSHNVNIRVVSGAKANKAAKQFYKEQKIYIKAKKVNETINKKFANWKYPVPPVYTENWSVKNWSDWITKNGEKISGWRKGKTAIIEKGEKPKKRLKNVRVRRVPKKDLFEKPGTFKKFTTLSGLFDTSIISDIDALKKEYFKLAKIYHPDRGGTTAQMQQLVNEYENLLKKLLQGSPLTNEQKANEIQLDEAMRIVINQLIGLEGLDVQIVGKWIWIGGQTYPVRNELKKAGLIFIKKQGVPYWVYKGIESRGKGNLTIEEIKTKYGAKKIDLPGGLKKLSGFNINKTRLLFNLKKVTKALNKRPK